jgi:hypothetical protein
MEENIPAWVARDENGSLYLYKEKPLKYEHLWKPSFWSYDEYYYSLNDHFNLPQVKWEDKEPTKVELVIRICE